MSHPAAEVTDKPTITISSKPTIQPINIAVIIDLSTIVLTKGRPTLQSTQKTWVVIVYFRRRSNKEGESAVKTVLTEEKQVGVYMGANLNNLNKS